MIKMKTLAVAIMAASITLTGCASKQQGGTFIGAGVGGVACNLLTKKSGGMTQLLATAGCAAIGGFIGNQIGKSLDERDQVALSEKTQQALNTTQAGTYDWKSEHSGATAKITVGQAYTKTESVEVKRIATVQPVATMQKINAPYLTLKGANVRSGPSTTSEKMGFLQAMTEFTAIGKSGDWIMVGRKGVAVGYIHKDLVESKASYAAKAAAAPSNSAVREVAVASPTKATEPPAKALEAAIPTVKLDEASVASAPEVAKLVEPAPEISTTVASQSTCRNMESSVTDPSGKVEKSTASACKKPDDNMWAGA